MSDRDHSLRKFRPDFVISPDTQVVVQVGKAPPAGDECKPVGRVGVILEALPRKREQ